MGLNVSLDLSLRLKALGRPLQESIRELRRGYQSVSECLEQALADCEQRGSELADCRHQLVEARQSLSQCERQIADRAGAEADLSNRCATLEQHLEIKTAELSQAHEKVIHAQAECAQHHQRLELQAEQSDELGARIARLESDYGEARDELGQLRGQFAPLAETASEAARLRGELDAAQADIARLRDQAAPPGEGAELQAQLSEVQAERQQLQVELDAVRQRATELTEALAEQQQGSAAERDRWSEELRHMRQVLEQQSETWSQRASQASEDAAALAATKEQLIQAEAQIVQSKERLQDQVEQNEQFREEIKRFESHREVERDELAQLRGQIAPLGETANEAARLHGELASAQAEIGRLRDQMADPAQGEELQQQLRALQAERDGWNEELRQVHQALDRQSEAWAERADQTAEDAHALAAANEQVLKAEAEIAQGKERLQIQVEHNQQLQEESKHLEANRETARDELAQLRGQFAPLAESAAQAAQLRAELDSANTELGRLTDQFAQAPDAAALEEQLTAAEVERQKLEKELDLLRHRGAELVEQLAEEKRVATAQREGWSEELRQLRKAVEMQSEVLAQRGSPQPVAESIPETAPRRAKHSNGAKPVDNVLGSVMEQFETLQKTKVRKLAKSKR